MVACRSPSVFSLATIEYPVFSVSMSYGCVALTSQPAKHNIVLIMNSTATIPMMIFFKTFFSPSRVDCTVHEVIDDLAIWFVIAYGNRVAADIFVCCILVLSCVI